MRRFVRRPTSSLLAAIALLVAGCSSRGHGAPSAAGSGPRGAAAIVVHIVDGDTIDVRFTSGVERVRLLGMDTPETVKPGVPVQCYGPEASARLKALLPLGSSVLVQRDEDPRDRYGRLLLYIWRASDGLFIDRSLVADGFARILSISPNFAHRAELDAAAAEAQRARRGLWGRCPPEPPRQGGRHRRR